MEVMTSLPTDGRLVLKTVRVPTVFLVAARARI
jgi:hypothetical protein